MHLGHEDVFLIRYNGLLIRYTIHKSLVITVYYFVIFYQLGAFFKFIYFEQQPFDSSVPLFNEKAANGAEIRHGVDIQHNVTGRKVWGISGGHRQGISRITAAYLRGSDKAI